MTHYHQQGMVADVHQYVSDVIMGVDDEERENIRAFADYIEDWCQSNQITLDENCFYPLVQGFGVYDLNKLYPDLLKERSVLSALWVIFLRVHRMIITDESIFKYRTLADFLAEYNGEFDLVETGEKMRLFYTANWIALVLKMVPAKRNKGFFLHVIPKLVEGFHIKYVTGSGQSKATADRVRIFEHEGQVKKVLRKKPERQLSNSSVTSNASHISVSGLSRELSGRESIFALRDFYSSSRESSRDLSHDIVEFETEKEDPSKMVL